MKKTTDPLKPVANKTAAADATKVNVNAPKAPINIRTKISDIPNRFEEKQKEQIDMMRKRGYVPEYGRDANNNSVLIGYVPRKKFDEQKTDSQGYIIK